MSAFTPVGADGGPLDPTKSVRYVEGMVLGVDDFQQEHFYLASLAQEALRLGVGVGTLWGLKVDAVKPVAAVPEKIEVHVGRGLAIDGLGRMIRVPEEQCADLGAWIVAKSDTIPTKVTVAPADKLKGTLPLQVIIKYAPTETDTVPVPGEPCRSDDQLMAASRWRDDYQLDFSLDSPPIPRLKEAMRQFLVWTKFALNFGAAATQANAVDGAMKSLRDCRTALVAAAAPAAPTRLLPATIPATVTSIAVKQDDVETQMACIDAANVVFVTELLPDWLSVPPAEALLLAEMQVAVKRATIAATDPWTLDTSGAAPPTSSRARLIALAGPALRIGPRLP